MQLSRGRLSGCGWTAAPAVGQDCGKSGRLVRAALATPRRLDNLPHKRR
jgi:hypothetical protein